MPTTESGRNKILKWLDENDTSVATLAAMYGLNVQDARDYLSGRKDAPAGARFILKVMRDLKIKQEVTASDITSDHSAMYLMWHSSGSKKVYTGGEEMTEFENVREALEWLYSIGKSEGNVTVDGRPATIPEIQDMYNNTIVNICDLLGMSDIYLEDQEG